ncbi:MAG TPA: CoA ester lyase [Geminicoccaceae bacterium]|nr:CoA ester lyase [Geminicoccaceae bacterium]
MKGRITVRHGTLARSLLYTPATRSDRFEKAVGCGADIVAVDLEDAVAPGDKPVARRNASAWLAAPYGGRAARAVRINGTRTMDGLRDILAIVDAQAQPDFILVPKVEAAADLEQLDALLQGPLAGVRFIALIESATALARLDEIARSTARLAALQLGSADLAADLRAANCWETLLHARSLMVRAAAAAAIEVLDAPCFDLASAGALDEEIRGALRLGFTGKSAVHPKQIAPINDAFSPTEKEVEHAKAVLGENEKGVGLVAGQMIDEAVARRARRVLAVARAVAEGAPA